MTNVRERVARAIHGVGGTDAINDNWSLRSPLNVYDGERAHQWRIDQADAAIAAMGLPTREQVEAALDDFNEAIIMEERGFCSEKAILAERQRLLAMIPMTEATDER